MGLKARIKATGEIVEVENSVPISRHGALFYGYKDANGIEYLPNEIDLQMDFDYWEACQDETPDTPDYWTRLEHTYAGMAMQGILSNPELFKATAKNAEEFGLIVPQAVAIDANCFAHALVKKIKEERK